MIDVIYIQGDNSCSCVRFKAGMHITCCAKKKVQTQVQAFANNKLLVSMKLIHQER
jgi:hypothetical protein